MLSGIGAIDEVKGVAKNADYAKFVSGLVLSEKEAMAKGRGVWQGTEHVTLWNRIKNYFKRH